MKSIVSNMVIPFALSLLLILSSLPITGPTASSEASTEEYDCRFVHMPHTVSFTDPTGPPTNAGPSPVVTTSWGEVKFKSSTTHYLLESIKWKGVTIKGTMYDTYIEYWWYNGTVGSAGRPIAAAAGWSVNWFEVMNNSFVTVYEKYGEAPTPYSGTTKEFNWTIRFAVFHQLPLIKVDGWLRFRNTSSLIRNININPVMVEGGLTGAHYALDTEYRFAYREADDYTWALGVMAPAYMNPSRGFHSFNKYHVNRSIKMAEPLHVSELWVLGDTQSDLQVLATKVGWHYGEYAATPGHRNLAVVLNGTGAFDCLRWCEGDKFTYYPSSELTYVYENGVMHEYSFGDNPIKNYEKLPLVLWVDDLWGGNESNGGTKVPVNFLLNITRKYNISLTFAGTWEDMYSIGASYRSWIQSWNDGTLIEVGDHGYNHGNMYSPTSRQAYGWQYENATATQTRNALYSSTPVTSWAAPYGTWSYNTWDAFGAAGFRMLRLGSFIDDGVRAILYNSTNPNSQVLVTGFWGSNFNWKSDTYVKTTRIGLGFGQRYIHLIDCDTPAEQDIIEQNFAWTQNQSDILSMTASAFYDHWLHFMKYYKVDGVGIIDLQDCITNHVMRLKTHDGQFPLLWDITNNRMAPTGKYNARSGEYEVMLEKGTKYRVLGYMRADDDVNVSVTAWRNGDSAFAASVSGKSGSIEVTLNNMEPGAYYDLYMDGTFVRKLHSDGNVSFKYDGPWSEHTFVVKESAIKQVLDRLFMPLVGVVLVLAVLSGLIGIVINGVPKRR